MAIIPVAWLATANIIDNFVVYQLLGLQMNFFFNLAILFENVYMTFSYDFLFSSSSFYYSGSY